MTTTPRVWKSLSQVNTSDAPVAPGGTASQVEGQIAPLQDGGYVVVWTDTSRMYNPFGFAIVGQRYDAAGNKVGGEVKISQFSDGDQRSPAVTVLANGNIAVAFVDIFGFNDDIYVRIFDPALNLVREDVIDRGVDQTYEPSITALTDGSYVVSYTMSVGDPAAIDVAMRKVSATGVVSGQVDIDNQTDSQIMSELAKLSNGNFVAVYRDDFNGTLNDTDIKYEIFTPVGTPVAGPANVPGGVGFGLETEPDVAALRDGGFVVVWTDPDSSVTDIRASILSNSGSPVAFDILVNTTTAGEQNEARIVALADGGFLVTWEDDNANLVRAQRFDATGQKIGTEFTVKNGISPAVEESPEAAVLSDGRIAYAIGDFSTGDLDVMTSIYSIAAPNDFNGNGISDILWQNSDGTPAMWLMNGTNAVSVGAVGPFNPGPSWQVKDSDDFNDDGISDILWQNNDGTAAIWLMNGLTATVHRRRWPVQSGAELADQGYRRLQLRQQGRHPVAEQRRHARDLADERPHRAVHRRRRPVQSGTELADQGHRRFQQRRQVRHPVAEQRRHARDLADERHECRGNGCRRSVQSGAELADQGHRRLQQRRQVRHPVAEQRRHARDLVDGRHECRGDGCRRPVQSGAELARRGHRRLQRRRQVRHPVAARQRHAGDLVHERHELHLRQRGRLVQSGE